MKLTNVKVLYILPEMDGIHSAAIMEATYRYGFLRRKEVQKTLKAYGNGQRWYYMNKDDWTPCSEYVNQLIAKAIIKNRYNSWRETLGEGSPFKEEMEELTQHGGK